MSKALFIYASLFVSVMGYAANKGSDRQVSTLPFILSHCIPKMAELGFGGGNIFPSVEVTEADDGALRSAFVPVNEKTFLAGYREGYFFYQNPETKERLWYAPPQRGIVVVADVARSKAKRDLRGLYNNHGFQITFDKAFSEVVRNCKIAPRFGENAERNWLSDELEVIYNQLYRDGFGHSTEVWDGNKLVGGAFGIYVAGVFYGESQFHNSEKNSADQWEYSNTGKLAALYTFDWLEANNVRFMDIQVVKPTMIPFGGHHISREAYMNLLKTTHAQYYGSPLLSSEVPTNLAKSISALSQ